jgi:DNA primase catalytic core
MRDQPYVTSLDLVKPPIVEIISRYVPLRRTGKEYTGRCPFHDDKHPSFSVNEEKQVFHCFGCQEAGDVVRFVMKFHGISFPEALAELGMDTSGQKQPPRITPSRRHAAERAAAWAIEQRRKLNVVIADILERRDLADEANDSDLGDMFDREWFLLSEFYDALEYPRGIVELLAVRQSVDAITAGVRCCFDD